MNRTMYADLWKLMDSSATSTEAYNGLYKVDIDTKKEKFIYNNMVYRILKGTELNQWNYYMHIDSLANAGQSTELDITGGAIITADLKTALGKDEIANYCMMMPEEAAAGKAESLGVVAIPNNDGNWKNSVSIGGVVCISLCVFQVMAYFRPPLPKPAYNPDEHGTEM